MKGESAAYCCRRAIKEQSSTIILYIIKRSSRSQLTESIGDLLAASPRRPAALVHQMVLMCAHAVRLALGARRRRVRREGRAVLDARREARRVERVHRRVREMAYRRVLRGAGAGAGGSGREDVVVVVVRVGHFLFERRRVRRLRLLDLHEAVVFVRLHESSETVKRC